MVYKSVATDTSTEQEKRKNKHKNHNMTTEKRAIRTLRERGKDDCVFDKKVHIGLANVSTFC